MSSSVFDQSTNIRYLEILEQWIGETELTKNDICLVASAVLADFDLRKNRDIDIAVHPLKRHLILDQSIPEEIEIAEERYSWLGITDSEIILDKTYHYHSNGFKIAKPEVVYSFKQRREAEKDKEDIELIEERFIDARDYEWDWELFSYFYYPSHFGKCGLPTSAPKNSLVARFERRIREDGVTEAARAATNFILRQLPIIDQTNGDRVELSSDDTLYFIIWPTASKFEEAIIRRIDNEFNVISIEKLNLDSDMANFIEEVYEFDEKDRLLKYKKYRISNDGDRAVVVATNCPTDAAGKFDSEGVHEFKNDLRASYFPYISDCSYHNIIHSPGSLEENEWVNQVVEKYAATSTEMVCQQK